MYVNFKCIIQVQLWTSQIYSQKHIYNWTVNSREVGFHMETITKMPLEIDTQTCQSISYISCQFNKVQLDFLMAMKWIPLLYNVLVDLGETTQAKVSFPDLLQYHKQTFIWNIFFPGFFFLIQIPEAGTWQHIPATFCFQIKASLQNIIHTIFPQQIQLASLLKMNYTIWHFHATIHKQGFHRCLILDLKEMMCDSPIVDVDVDDKKKG